MIGGRQIGKSTALVYKMLEQVSTPTPKQVIYITQVRRNMDRIRDRIKKLCKIEFTNLKITEERVNYLKINKHNNIHLTSINSYDSIRGKSADGIYMDETKYISDTAFHTICVASDNINVAMTPTNLRQLRKFSTWSRQVVRTGDNPDIDDDFNSLHNMDEIEILAYEERFGHKILVDRQNDCIAVGCLECGLHEQGNFENKMHRALFEAYVFGKANDVQCT